MRLWSPLLVGLLFAASVHAASRKKDSELVHIQAAEGSFNHQAFMIMNERSHENKLISVFTNGSPVVAMERAAQGGLASCAVVNSAAGLVEDTVAGLQKFEITSVISSVEIPVPMALMRKVGDHSDLKKAYGHPKANQQVTEWAATFGDKLELIDVPEGASEAAVAVAKSDEEGLGIVGPATLCNLVKAKEGLTPIEVVAERIEDKREKPNTTLFFLSQVALRASPISKEEARAYLKGLIDEVRESSAHRRHPVAAAKQ